MVYETIKSFYLLDSNLFEFSPKSACLNALKAWCTTKQKNNISHRQIKYVLIKETKNKTQHIKTQRLSKLVSKLEYKKWNNNKTYQTWNKNFNNSKYSMVIKN